MNTNVLGRSGINVLSLCNYLVKIIALSCKFRFCLPSLVVQNGHIVPLVRFQRACFSGSGLYARNVLDEIADTSINGTETTNYASL